MKKSRKALPNNNWIQDSHRIQGQNTKINCIATYWQQVIRNLKVKRLIYNCIKIYVQNLYNETTNIVEKKRLKKSEVYHAHGSE